MVTKFMKSVFELKTNQSTIKFQIDDFQVVFDDTHSMMQLFEKRNKKKNKINSCKTFAKYEYD